MSYAAIEEIIHQIALGDYYPSLMPTHRPLWTYSSSPPNGGMLGYKELPEEQQSAS